MKIVIEDMSDLKSLDVFKYDVELPFALVPEGMECFIGPKHYDNRYQRGKKVNGLFEYAEPGINPSNVRSIVIRTEIAESVRKIREFWAKETVQRKVESVVLFAKNVGLEITDGVIAAGITKVYF